MNVIRLAILAMIVMLTSCPDRKGAGNDDAVESPHGNEADAAKGVVMTEPSKLIHEDAIQGCVETRGFIAWIHVNKATVTAIGTRGEAARIAARVEQIAYGDAGEQINIWRYTGGGDALLKKGKQYIVAVTGRGDGTVRPFVLMDYVEVVSGHEEASVQTHKALVAKFLEKP